MKKLVLAAVIFMVTLAILTAAAKPTKNECTTIQDGILTSSSGDIITTGYMDNGYNYQAHIYNGEYYPGWKLVMKWNDAWLSNKDCDGDGLLDRHYGYDSYIGSGAWETNHWFTEYEITHWDISGNWEVDLSGFERQFVNLLQDTEGNVIGEFWYLSGSEWVYGGTLNGTVTGDQLYLQYVRPAPLTYTGEFYGTIGEDIITEGIFTDNKGNELTWTATGDSVATYEQCYAEEFIKIIAVPADAVKEDGVWYDAQGTRIGVDIWGQFAIIQDNWYDSCDLEGSFEMHEPRPGLGNW